MPTKTKQKRSHILFPKPKRRYSLEKPITSKQKAKQFLGEMHQFPFISYFYYFMSILHSPIIIFHLVQLKTKRK